MGAKVTTKTGDQGNTRTLGGETLTKADAVIECSGWLDTARAHTALLRLRLVEADAGKYQDEAEVLLWLAHCYFLIGCYVNDPEGAHPEYRPCEFSPAFLQRLEAEQEKLQTSLNLPSAFIVSASNLPAAECDVLATTVRTFERRLVALKAERPALDASVLMPFINRLSDFFFVLARHLEEGHHQVVDYKKLES